MKISLQPHTDREEQAEMNCIMIVAKIHIHQLNVDLNEIPVKKCSTVRYNTEEQTDKQAFKTTTSMPLAENVIIKLKGICRL